MIEFAQTVHFLLLQLARCFVGLQLVLGRDCLVALGKKLRHGIRQHHIIPMAQPDVSIMLWWTRACYSGIDNSQLK